MTDLQYQTATGKNIRTQAWKVETVRFKIISDKGVNKHVDLQIENLRLQTKR